MTGTDESMITKGTTMKHTLALLTALLAATAVQAAGTKLWYDKPVAATGLPSKKQP
jgi:hypothetical protein